MQFEVSCDEFSGGLESTFMINPELRRLLDFLLVHVAASTITAAVLAQLPKVLLLLTHAAVTIATAVNLNFKVGTLFSAESITLTDEGVHEMVIGVLRVSLWHHIWVTILSFGDGYSNITVLFLKILGLYWLGLNIEEITELKWFVGIKVSFSSKIG